MSSALTLKIVNRSGHDLPSYQTVGAAGFDLRACLSVNCIIHPGERKAIPTGIYVSVPCGYELQIRARSGLSLKYGIALVNGIGTVDSDYRGEIQILMVNLGTEDFVIQNGDRIAQGVLAPCLHANFVEVETLDETERGSGGFGSTGV